MRRFRLIVVVASAGGVEALSRLVSQLPSSFPLPIAIVQHRSMHLPNLLAKVLQRKTELPLRTVEDGDEIVSGVVYVAPPGIHLVVGAQGRFALIDGLKVRHVRPSGDVLFASAAEVFGPRVIALVLTGGDGDGANGVKIVKDCGGTVISQDEASSQVPSMPESAIATGAVDYILPLGEIASILVTLSLLTDERADTPEDKA